MKDKINSMKKSKLRKNLFKVPQIKVLVKMKINQKKSINNK